MTEQEIIKIMISNIKMAYPINYNSPISLKIRYSYYNGTRSKCDIIIAYNNFFLQGRSFIIKDIVSRGLDKIVNASIDKTIWFNSLIYNMLLKPTSDIKPEEETLLIYMIYNMDKHFFESQKYLL